MYRRFRNDNRVFEAGTKKTKKGEAGVLKHNHKGMKLLREWKPCHVIYVIYFLKK